MALQDFNKCISLDPSDGDWYYFRARYYYRKQLYNASIADFTKAISLEPGKAANLRGRGDTYMAAGAYGAAIIDYENSLRVDTGEYASPYFTHISIISPLVRTSNFLDAKKYADLTYEKSVFRYIEDRPIRYFIDVIRTDLPAKQYTSALAKLELANSEYALADLNEEDGRIRYSDVLVLKGYILEKMGRNVQAKEVYEQALLINATQPDVKNALAALEEKKTVINTKDLIAPVVQLISPQAARGLQVVGLPVALAL